MSTDYKIEFKRVERVCLHNDKARAGDKDRRMIYDFNVFIDGEHRVTFVNRFSSRGYLLRTPDNATAIIEKKDGGRWDCEIAAQSQAEFHKIINVALDKSLIPTLAQLEQIKIDRQSQEAAKLREQQSQERMARIKEAGPALLDALAALFADWKTMISEKQARDGKPAPDFETYPMAIMATQAIDLATKEPEEPS